MNKDPDELADILYEIDRQREVDRLVEVSELQKELNLLKTSYEISLSSINNLEEQASLNTARVKKYRYNLSLLKTCVFELRQTNTAQLYEIQRLRHKVQGYETKD